ncbi:MAG: hypothetical protein MUE85_15395 [Microscillaceae bacterium]|nr:hypothetical protein [Microscillaceae bacterium]
MNIKVFASNTTPLLVRRNYPKDFKFLRVYQVQRPQQLVVHAVVGGEKC